MRSEMDPGIGIAAGSTEYRVGLRLAAGTFFHG
jgi:hypothetical protein